MRGVRAEGQRGRQECRSSTPGACLCGGCHRRLAAGWIATLPVCWRLGMVGRIAALPGSVVADLGRVGGESSIDRVELAAFLKKPDDAGRVESFGRAGMEAGFGAELVDDGGLEGFAGEC